MARGFLMGEGLYADIKRTIARVDGTPEGSGPTRIPTRFEGGPPPATPQPIRLAAYPRTVAWNQGGTAQVSFYTHTGTAYGLVSAAADGTATALNVCGDFITLPNGDQSEKIGPTPTMTWCIVAKSRGGANVAIEGPRKGSQLAAYSTADGEWQKGESREVAFYAVVGGQVVATGETATAGNVSHPYYPLSTATQGTASGPTSTMAWCVVSQNPDGSLVVTESEQSPVTRLGTVTPDDWQRGSMRTVTSTSSNETYDVYSVFDDYSELDLKNGVVFTKSLSPAGDGQTAHVVIGPPPIPLHEAVYESGGDWQRGEEKTVSVLPSGGATASREITAVNRHFDSIEAGDKPLAIGKIGTSYHVIAGQEANSIKAGTRVTFGDKDTNWNQGSSEYVRVTGSTQQVLVTSLFDTYSHLDLHDGLTFAKSKDPNNSQTTAYIVVSPSPSALHIASTTQTGLWSRDEEKVLSVPPSAGRTGTLTINVTNKFFDDIELDGNDVAVGKFGGQFHALTGGSPQSMKLAERVSDGTWDVGSQRTVRFFGTTTEAQAYNIVGHYEDFDGRGSGGGPGLVLTKGKELAGQDGTAWYVVSPPPTRFLNAAFSGAWPIGQQKSVESQSPSATINVTNELFPITCTAAGSKSCAIAKKRDQWYLVGVEMETATAVFSRETASITFYGTGSTSSITYLGDGATQTITVASTQVTQSTFSVLTDVTVEFDPESCSVNVNKQTDTVSAVTGIGSTQVTIVDLGATQTAAIVSVSGTQTMTISMSTYTASYIRIKC